MAVNRKKATYGQLNHMDRLSDLPDSILHHIISFLDTEEACRTSILSKRWTHIWSTGLILEFKIDGDFEDESVGSGYGPYSYETYEKLNFIESTMRRYSENNLSIRKFTLAYPIIDSEMARRIDRWVGIALRNQVEELSLSVLVPAGPLYVFPAIFFSAKSLMSLKLRGVILPYIKDTKLTSLQSLDLTDVHLNEQMLQHIIMSCPLRILKFDRCFYIENISIPCCSRLESLHAAPTQPMIGTILVDTTSLQRFTYNGYNLYRVNVWWPVILTPGSKKNLKELRILGVHVESDGFGKLVSELPSIEKIAISGCIMDDCIKIASQTLKEVDIHGCDDLSTVKMEAPELDTFCYNGRWQLSSVTNSHNNYNAYFHLTSFYLDTRAFYGIKQFLSKSDCCKVLSITIKVGFNPEITFDEGQLSNFHPGPPSDAIDVPELKLAVLYHIPTSEESTTCRALIDGLLWCCRPDILSVSFTSSANSVIKTFLEILQEKVKYWKHPLKRMEIEGANSSSLLSPLDLEVRIRLYW